MDYYFLIFMIPALLLSLAASAGVRSTYAKYSKVLSQRGMTGRDAAEYVLRSHSITDVNVVPIPGELTDHFDPRNRTIGLSEGVYNSTSVAALGVAAHEAGHAVQHQEQYWPIRVRNAILPVASIGSSLSWYLILFGLILDFLFLAELGVAFFGIAVLFQLITLPVEFNASRRAMTALETGGILSSEELSKTGKVLRAAAMTYVAALAVSILQLLRYVLMVSGRRRD